MWELGTAKVLLGLLPFIFGMSAAWEEEEEATGDTGEKRESAEAT